MATQYANNYFTSQGFEDPEPNPLSQGDIDSIKPNKPKDEDYFKTQGFEDPSSEAEGPGLMSRIGKLANTPLTGGILGTGADILVKKEQERAQNVERALGDIGIPEGVSKVLNFPGEAIARGGRVAANTLEGITTPLNLGLLATDFVVPGASAVTGPIFGGQQLYGAYETGKEGAKQFKEGNYGQALEDFSTAGLQGGFGLLGFKGLKGGIERSKGVVQPEIAGIKEKMSREAKPEILSKEDFENNIRFHGSPFELEKITQGDTTSNWAEASKYGDNVYLIPKENISSWAGGHLGETTNYGQTELGSIKESSTPLGKIRKWTTKDLDKKSAYDVYSDKMLFKKINPEQVEHPHQMDKVLKDTDQAGLDLIREEAKARASDEKGIFGKAADIAEGFISKDSPMAKKLGGWGTELVHRVNRGINDFSDVAHQGMEYFENYKNLVKDKGVDSKAAKDRIATALEDRANKDNILSPNKSERLAYDNLEKMYDSFIPLLEKKGIGVRENYMTHSNDVIQFMDNLQPENVPGSITSNFAKHRRVEGGEYSKDLDKIVPRYIMSISRMLAHDDTAQWYMNTVRPEAVKAGAKPEDIRYADRYMKDVLTPQESRFPTAEKLVGKAKGMYYKSLNWRPLSMAKNSFQHSLIQMNTTGEGRKLGQIIRNAGDEKINSFLDSGHTTLYNEFAPDMVDKPQGLYQKIESRNWKIARSAAMGDAVMRTPEYKQFKAKGMSQVEATYRALQDPKVFDEVTKRAENLASKTQVNMSLAYRPEIFRNLNPIGSILSTFKSFPLRMVQLAGKELLGGSRGRAVDLMKNGLSEDASMGEVYLGLTDLQKAIKSTKAKYKGSPEEMASIKQVEKDINKQVKNYKTMMSQALPGNPAKAAAILAGTAALSGGMNQIWRTLGQTVNESIGLNPAKDKSIMEDIGNELPGVSLLKGGIASSPLLPSDWESGSDYAIRNAIMLTPGLMQLESMIPGNVVSKGAKAGVKALTQ